MTRPTKITNRMRALRATGTTPSTCPCRQVGNDPTRGRTNRAAVLKAIAAGVPVAFIAERYRLTPNAIWQVRRRARLANLSADTAIERLDAAE